MAIKKTVAIIGGFTDGISLMARNLAHADVRLVLMGAQGHKLKALKKELAACGTEVDWVPCEKEASWEADVIILMSPDNAQSGIVEKIKPVATGKVVISFSNPSDSNIHEPVASYTIHAAEELQKLLPYCHVVKAFNTVAALSSSSPIIEGVNKDIFIAGDDPEAVKTAVRLLEAAALHPVLTGRLREGIGSQREHAEAI